MLSHSTCSSGFRVKVKAPILLVLVDPRLVNILFTDPVTITYSLSLTAQLIR